jgi:hypothetical protein
MSTFKLTKDADTYEFGLDGSVKKGTAKFGGWTTNAQNQLVASGANGTQVVFSDLTWKFTDKNQLTLRTAADKEIFNFHKLEDTLPFYKVSALAVLQVFPDETGDFNFELRGKWSFDENHDLGLNINGVQSLLKGYVDDPKSRFTYFFFDKDTNDFNLVFQGEWLNPEVGATTTQLTFKYAKEEDKQEPDKDKQKFGFFTLPGSITIDRSINQFVYDYNKDKKRRRIKFAGLLNVTKDFQLVYSLDQQEAEDDAGVLVKATEFRLGAVLSMDKFAGDLEFILRKTSDGKASKTVVGIRGHFTAEAKNAQVQIGFAFLQVRDGKTTTTSVALNGSLVLKGNLTVQWEFAMKDNVKSLAVTITDITLGPVTANSKVVIESANGQKRAVQLLLGFSF